MIKKIVDSGVLGKIYYIQTGGGRRRGIPNSTFIEKQTAGIGALGDIGCYSLDMVLNAIGYPKPLTVSGYKSAYFGTNPKYATPDKFHTAEENAKRFGVDDFAAAFIRLEGDVILDFRIAWAMHVGHPRRHHHLRHGGRSAHSLHRLLERHRRRPDDAVPRRGRQPCARPSIPLIPHKGPGLFDSKIRSFLDAIEERHARARSAPARSCTTRPSSTASCKSAEAGHEIKIEIPEISI